MTGLGRDAGLHAHMVHMLTTSGRGVALQPGSPPLTWAGYNRPSWPGIAPTKRCVPIKPLVTRPRDQFYHHWLNTNATGKEALSDIS